MPMRPSAVLELKRGAIRADLAAFGVASAGVFGSVARGEDTSVSDLDIVVRFRDGHPRDLIRLSEALRATTGLPVDVVDIDDVRRRLISTGLGSSILRETVPL